MTKKISVVINTFNSAKTLPQCLEGVKDFDEIVVCDMYSTDDTLSIARSYNCKIVMYQQVNGIVEPARMYAITLAGNEWVLVVDSDEVVTSDLKNYLYQKIRKGDLPAALFIPRKNFFLNKWMRSSFPDYQLRFIRKDSLQEWPITIHSRPVINGKVGKLPKNPQLAFIHLDENRINSTINKWNKYTERELDRRKDKGSTLSLIFKPAFRFFHFFIIKKGFLDGKKGFIYASFMAKYKYLTIIKQLERTFINEEVVKTD